MNFNKHSNLIGQHAFLSASKYHWVRYDDNKLRDTFRNFEAIQMGTRLHELAKELITLGIKLPRTSKTLNSFVNDAIGYKMVPEQILYYSDNCFGTSDAVSFKNNMLRIHDLKTGITPASITQLEIYAALFCLEYRIQPNDISIELRIYQSDEVLVHSPVQEDILYIMQKIRDFDKLIEELKVGDLRE